LQIITINMKKVLMLLSISIMTLWIVCFLILKMPPAIHILLIVSLLLYIRSLLHINSSVTQKFYGEDKSVK
jgi:1,4-dihydroxy-2-naphthoate octaprenyltransferase